MVHNETIRQQTTELKEAVNKAYEGLKDGTVTEAEFNQTCEHAEKEFGNQAVLVKSKARANSFNILTGEDGGDSGEGAAPSGDSTPDGIKDMRQNFASICKAARPSTRHKSIGSFNFGLKSWHEHDSGVRVKTGMPIGPYQGVAGLSGENATGTTAGAALAGGAYFLTGTAGPAIEPEFIPGIVELRFFPTIIESLFPAMPVSSPIVTYVKETTWTNNAAATGEGATKPTSTHTLTRLAEQIGKVANLERTTDEMIQDAEYVWALFQRRLVQGVQRMAEVELLAGGGYPGVNGLYGRSTSFLTPQSVSAISNLVIPAYGTAGTGSGTDTVASVTPGRAIVAAAGSTDVPTGTDIAVAVLNMLTDIRVQTMFEPDAIVLNPLDWVTVRLSTDKNGQFMGGSFFGRDYGYPNDQGSLQAGGVDTFALWAKKTVTTPVQPQGLVLVGDFADAGAVLTLGGLRVDVTNLNGTDFEQNMWTARAERRLGLLIERPNLFELAVITTSGAMSS
jgi:HK97 family phage major capsid protein